MNASSLKPLVPVLVLLAAMWLVEVVDWALPAQLDQYGIESRDPGALPGIIASPMLHADFAHLMANTVPFLILGAIVALRNPSKFWPILITITLLGGFGVWLLGPSNVITVGVSGVVFGLLTYLLTAGVITRHWLDVLIALVVLLLYGGILGGALPFGTPAGVSWLAHLTGAIAGVLAGVLFAPRRTRHDTTPQLGTAGLDA